MSRNCDGKSVPPGPNGGGPQLAELWETTEMPVDNRGNDDRARPVYELLPRANGSLLRVFDILPEPFSLENGLLTPTLKPRRGRISMMYEGLIGRLYDRIEGEQARGGDKR